ncbi:hypothetical protein RB595_005279 [Gaeumannomyces hyphopodioides]
MAGSQAVSKTANGVLPAPQAKPQPQAGAGASSRSGKGKTPVEGQKVVLRRLPPGITEQETVSFLSDEWKPGGAKVGWFSFQAGKISKDPAKPSRPSRAYLHVLKTEQVMGLVEHVRNTEWLDAKDTSASSCLVGPPVLDISIYKKVPSGKVRADARAGTIDQDPEFMDFLEALANPNKDPEADHTAEEDEKQITKASSTPLIDYLREKKANKAKESATGKSGKHSRHEPGTAKGKSSEDPKKRTRDSKTEKSTEKPRENVKILTKKAAVEAAAEAANAVASQIMANAKEKEELTKTGRRAGIAAAARILQRDLGLSPGNAHRRARQEAAKAESEAKGSTSSPATKDAVTTKENAKAAPAASTTVASPAASETATTAARPSTPTAPKAAAGSSSRGVRGKKGTAGEKEKGGREKKGATDKSGEASSAATPKAPIAILKKKDREESKQEGAPPASTANGSAEGKATATTTNSASATAKVVPNGLKAPQGKGASGSGKKSRGEGSSNSTPNVSPAATRAFVKHANPSQGVTEALLKEVMQAFGTVTFVEMDKRKGFAYVDFADHDCLVKAIAASPVSVAQATVQVLERKDKEAAPKKGGGGKDTSATPSSSKTNDGGKGGSGSGPAPPLGPKSTPTGPKAEAAASGAARSATPPTGPAADKDKAAGEHKRGGRRRGGRGRGGDPKDSGSSKAASAGAGATSTPAAPSAAA